jgi:uncharacterized protein
MQPTHDDLLGLGITRLFDDAEYTDPGGYARIVYRLPAPAVPALAPAGSIAPEAVQVSPAVLVDLETLGFVGRPLFLIGALFYDADDSAATRLIQYLARDYSEEEAVLRAFLDEVRAPATWITFNGRTFDLPVLGLRAAYYSLPPPIPARHLDLLPVARRLWGPGLPDCRLTTLEARICGRWRGGDIGGARIPSAYHAFVATGEPWEMLQILRHNASDLQSLGDLLSRVLKERD